MRIEGDQIIMAVGQARDHSWIGDGMSLELNGDRIVVDQKSQATNVPGSLAAAMLRAPRAL